MTSKSFDPANRRSVPRVSARDRVLDDDIGFISLLSDADLLARLPALVRAECEATTEVVEHLVEVERRRLYLEQARSSIYKYCEERPGLMIGHNFRGARFGFVLEERREGDASPAVSTAPPVLSE
jgi:hypothetical protein